MTYNDAPYGRPPQAEIDDLARRTRDATRRASSAIARASRPTTVKPAGPFGGNSQSGRTAQHGTQSGYVMHRRAAKAEHDAAGPEHAAWCAGPSTHVSTCQPCKDAHAAYVRESGQAHAHGQALRQAGGDPGWHGGA